MFLQRIFGTVFLLCIFTLPFSLCAMNRDFKGENSGWTWVKDNEIVNDFFSLIEKKNAIPGLENTGTLCHINSILQALLSVKLFSKTMKFIKSKDPFIAEFASFIKKVSVCKSNYLDSSFQKFLIKETNLEEKQQQDAAESLRKILDGLFKGEKNIKRLFTVTWEVKNACSSGHISTATKVSDMILSLGIPLDEKKKHITTQDLVDYFFQEEYLENVRCEKCLLKIACTKYFKESLPPILVLQPKQFKDGNERYVPVKPSLCLRVGAEKYILAALVMRIADGDNGHYIALVKDRNEKNWVVCDDKDVHDGGDMMKTLQQQGFHEVCYDEEFFLSAHPYLLFYVKKG